MDMEIDIIVMKAPISNVEGPLWASGEVEEP